jgi:hypothetical protein
MINNADKSLKFNSNDFSDAQEITSDKLKIRRRIEDILEARRLRKEQDADWSYAS